MEMAILLAGLPLFWLLLGAILFLWSQRGRVVRYWREPMVATPVLVIESDDWGPGFAGQAEALARLRRLLRSYRDRDEHPAVMTVGVLLAAPDRRAMREEGCEEYRCLTLADGRYDALREEIRRGEAEGLFALQLHGREHFWPPALVARAQVEEGVRRWLTDPDEPEIYALPSYLQSRWVDTSTLPTRPLSLAEIERAVQGEVALYRDLFGGPPRVVVPPTFVWPEAIEQIWAELGVEVVVTPGSRYLARDEEGDLVPDGSTLSNGEVLADGTVAAVRNGYFEPRLGHGVEGALRSFAENLRCGRPTLLESHAFNYVGEEGEAGLQELANLLGHLTERYSNLRFVSTLELMRELREQGASRQLPLRHRLAIVAERLLAVWQLHRWRVATGASLWLRLLAGTWWLSAATREGTR